MWVVGFSTLSIMAAWWIKLVERRELTVYHVVVLEAVNEYSLQILHSLEERSPRLLEGGERRQHPRLTIGSYSLPNVYH